jgi:hypothetical protein
MNCYKRGTTMGAACSAAGLLAPAALHACGGACRVQTAALLAPRAAEPACTRDVRFRVLQLLGAAAHACNCRDESQPTPSAGMKMQNGLSAPARVPRSLPGMAPAAQAGAWGSKGCSNAARLTFQVHLIVPNPTGWPPTEVLSRQQRRERSLVGSSRPPPGARQPWETGSVRSPATPTAHSSTIYERNQCLRAAAAVRETLLRRREQCSSSQIPEGAHDRAAGGGACPAPPAARVRGWLQCRAAGAARSSARQQHKGAGGARTPGRCPQCRGVRSDDKQPNQTQLNSPSVGRQLLWRRQAAVETQ